MLYFQTSFFVYIRNVESGDQRLEGGEGEGSHVKLIKGFFFPFSEFKFFSKSRLNWRYLGTNVLNTRISGKMFFNVETFQKLFSL